MLEVLKELQPLILRIFL